MLLAASWVELENHITLRPGQHPEPAGGAPTLHIRVLDLHWRLVHLHVIAGQQFFLHFANQRLQPVGSLGHPVPQCAFGKIDPQALKLLLLSIQRQMVHVLAQKHMRHQARTGLTLGHHTRRQWRNADAGFAAHTRQFRPDNFMPDHLGRHVLITFALFAPDLALLFATMRTDLLLGLEPLGYRLQNFGCWLATWTWCLLLGLWHDYLLRDRPFSRRSEQRE